MQAAPRKNPLHSKASCEHGTPPAPVDVGRYALGRFTLDPMSSDYWNRYTVGAEQYFDRRANAMKQRWFGLVWVNPAGADDDADTDSLVVPGYERLLHFYTRGDVEAAVWYGYSLQQLQQLQHHFKWHPLRFPTLLFSKRQRHLVRPPGGGPPVPGEHPQHGNFMSLLPDRNSPSLRERQIARFVERGSKLGQVVRPW